MVEAVSRNKLLVDPPKERLADTTVNIMVIAENVHIVKVLLILHKVIKIGI